MPARAPERSAVVEGEMGEEDMSGGDDIAGLGVGVLFT